MEISVEIEIKASKKAVWAEITDIKNSARMIQSIIALEMLNEPESGLVGLKWAETRLMFGKEASETMWITEAVENEYYCTRAENCDSIYITQLTLNQRGKNTLLTMSFTGKSEKLFIKIISSCMSLFIKSAMRKALQKDLQDIKTHMERNYSAH